MATKLIDRYGCISPIIIWFFLGVYFLKNRYLNCLLINTFKKYNAIVTDIKISMGDDSSPSSLAHLLVDGEEKLLDLKYTGNRKAINIKDSLEVWCRKDYGWCFSSQSENKIEFVNLYYFNLLLFSAVFFLPLFFYVIKRIFR